VARRLGILVAAIALAVFALGFAVSLLTMPAFTSALSARYSLADEAGLTRAEAQSIAEDVRAFVVGGTGTLPETLGGRPAFDAAAVSHLADVRDVVASARFATRALAIGLLILGTWLWIRGRRDLIGAGLKAGGIATAVFVAGAAVIAVSDFDAFFSAFHGLFFAEGTWTFPYDSLLIRMFPEPFWSTSGTVWAAIALVLGLAYWLAGAWFVRGEATLRRDKRE